MVVEELGFVGGHVHGDGAFGGARFTGQAEIQGLVDLRGGEAVEVLAAVGLGEQSCAAAGGVDLVVRDLEGRAHRAAHRPAGPDADAAVDGAQQRTAVPTEGVHRGHLQPALRRPGPQALRDVLGPDQHAGVEDAVGIEDELELLEGVADRRGVHLAQQPGARAAVAVFPGEAAAVPGHEPGGVEHEMTEGPQPLPAEEVEADAHVHAALAEMPEGDAA